MVVLPFSVEPFGLSQAAVDAVKVFLGRGAPLLRFLLDGVENVDRFLKADRADGDTREP